MAIRRYLAMTASEIRNYPQISGHIGWMACHFSPGGTGITNFPPALPAGSLLILDDSIPPALHHPPQVLQELLALISKHNCSGVLLDFQRSGNKETARMAAFLEDSLPCPVAVAAGYADRTKGAVFVPPVPPFLSLEQWIAPWAGRELWLELALNGAEIYLTSKGSQSTPLPYASSAGSHHDSRLHCHYGITLTEDGVLFTLGRTREDLERQSEEAASMGIEILVGLFQELRDNL